MNQPGFWLPSQAGHFFGRAMGAYRFERNQPTTAYSIKVVQRTGESYSKSVYARNEASAIRAMRRWLQAHVVEGHAYLAWRAADGRTGYLNADGSVGPTGQPWPSKAQT